MTPDPPPSPAPAIFPPLRALPVPPDNADDKGRFPITDAVRDDIRRRMALIPDGHSMAFVGVVDSHGPRGMWAQRVGTTNWQLTAEGQMSWTGKISGNVAVLWSR